MRNLIVLTALLAFPHWCRAAETCLWLNEATAAGVLGGPVSLQVFHPAYSMPATGTANATSSSGPMSANPSAAKYVGMSTADEDCLFKRRDGTSGSHIRIEVRTTDQAHNAFGFRLASCGNDRDPLRAIGNEAVACGTVRADTSRSEETTEQIVGRVRDRVFVVRVSENGTAKDRPAIREKAKTAAQIVAGNLF